MKLGILTSTRADYGIYLPLILELKNDPTFETELIVFGSHLSRFHGYTINEIDVSLFSKVHKLVDFQFGDNPKAISTSYAQTVLQFAEFWESTNYDLVFCLGDRFEMSAAVQAGIPFRIKFSHLHGGETTLGVIDEIYRHQITHAAFLHFTSTKTYAKRVAELIGSQTGIYNVGSLSLDGLENTKLYTENEFRKKFDIPERKFLLITFHPETVYPENNKKLAKQMELALSKLADDYYLLITMPNMDTENSQFRNRLSELALKIPSQVKLIESMGKVGYFSAMSYSSCLVGNSSSGIIEAASFQKYVVNVGDRQAGRASGKNVLNCPFDSNEIISNCKEAISFGSFMGKNIYYQKEVAKRIINIIR